MRILEIPKCEVCGKPADYKVTDKIWHDDLLTNKRVYEPFGSAHLYCSSHRRSVKILDRKTGAIISED